MSFGLVSAGVSRGLAWVRGSALIATITLFNFQILPPGPDVSPLVKDGTQLGMYGVVLALLGWIRYDLAAQRTETTRQMENHRKDWEEERERNNTLNVKLISLIEVKVASDTALVASHMALKDATERLIKASTAIVAHQGRRHTVRMDDEGGNNG